jgi:NAD(P)-dependent dehydrogenase (short-subunit alcohol dehydrogenase family)
MMKNVMMKNVVLITGCSSGIGREAARRFAREGYCVYASMRRTADGAGLRAEAEQTGWTLTTPELDVTSDESVSAAVVRILEETNGRLDILINNAGYYCVGPIEETAPDELRAQFETNVIGVLRVTRAVLPAMRQRGQGAIVNVSSVSGRMVLPAVGPYHASKWALEAMTEALRYEMRPFGIRVTCVEPGPFKTEIHNKEVPVRDSLRSDSPYQRMMAMYAKRSGNLPRAELSTVVEVLFRAATHPRPRLRWAVGPSSFAGTVLRRFVPDGIYEFFIRLVFGLWRR